MPSPVPERRIAEAALALLLPLAPLLPLAGAGCSTTEHTIPTAEITQESVNPGTSVRRAGQNVALMSSGRLAVNQRMPEVALTDFDWKPYAFRADGIVKVISVVPSIDTLVCEQQTHLMAELPLNPKVQRIIISRDLPSAQRRFAAETALSSLTYLSDYRQGNFGKATGLLMEGSELLARAVLVVDGEGRVRYMQVVPEITKLPDLDRVLVEANRLTGP